MPPWKAGDSVPILQVRQHMQNQQVREPRLESRADLAALHCCPGYALLPKAFFALEREALTFLPNVIETVEYN